MFNLHLFELKWIRCLQLLRCPLLDKFFLCLNFFDTPYFSFILLPIIWIGYNRKWGIRFFYVILLNFLVSQTLKMIFGQPRPFQLDSNVGIITVKDCGFPSGAAQTVVLYSAIMLFYWKNKKWAWFLSINLVFWISLSRVYLGVHFISDIIGGYISGIIAFVIFRYIFPKIENVLSKRSLPDIFLINAIGCLILLTLPFNEIKHISMAYLFVGSGIVLSKNFNCFLPPFKSFFDSFLRLIVYALGAGLIVFFVTSGIFYSSIWTFFYLYALSGLWLSFLFGLIWNKAFVRR